MPSASLVGLVIWSGLIALITGLLTNVIAAYLRTNPRAAFGKRGARSLFELKGLLLMVFQAEELRGFLHLHLGAEGALVAHSLPTGDQSPEALTTAALVALERRGLIDGAFFDALVEERPRRELDIRRVQKAMRL